jgi:ABC-2 type transport system ATP-binding protein
VKLAFARALLPEPPVLLLDEPWAGLDPEARIEIMYLIESLGRKESKTILLCSHDLQMVERLCHRVAIIQGGEVIVAGAPSKLISILGGEGSITVGVNSQSEVLKKIDRIEGVVMGGTQGKESIYLISSNVENTLVSIYDVLKDEIVQTSSSKLTLEDVYLASIILGKRENVA